MVIEMRIDVNKLIEKNITDEVIVFQTDTVYGIGCKIGSALGVEKIYDIKKRDGNKPLAVLCATIKSFPPVSPTILG